VDLAVDDWVGGALRGAVEEGPATAMFEAAGCVTLLGATKGSFEEEAGDEAIDFLLVLKF